MNIKKYFSDEDLKKIREKVEEVEKSTGGEIVPYFSPGDPGAYLFVSWQLGLFFSLFSLFFAVYGNSNEWGHNSFGTGDFFYPIIALMGAVLGFGLSLIPSVRRFVVHPSILRENVERDAKLAFLEEGIFATKNRIGILIYISMFEKQIIILGDTGIQKKVPTEKWNLLVNLIAGGFKENQPLKGILSAIHECGELLKENGFTGEKKENELGDELRISEKSVRRYRNK